MFRMNPSGRPVSELAKELGRHFNSIMQDPCVEEIQLTRLKWLKDASHFWVEDCAVIEVRTGERKLARGAKGTLTDFFVGWLQSLEPDEKYAFDIEGCRNELWDEDVEKWRRNRERKQVVCIKKRFETIYGFDEHGNQYERPTDNSKEIDSYPKGGTYTVHVSAPGTGRVVYVVTDVDEDGLWGVQIENSVRMLTPEEVM